LDEYFTGVPNRVLTALTRITLPAYEIRVLFAVWRNVWGWQGREGVYSSSGKIAGATGLPRSKAYAVLQSLSSKRLIHITPRGNGIFIVPSREPAEWIIPAKDRATRERHLPLGPLDIKKSVTSTGNTRGDKVLPLQGAESATSTGYSPLLQILDHSQFPEGLKKVVKEIFKERASK